MLVYVIVATIMFLICISEFRIFRNEKGHFIIEKRASFREIATEIYINPDYQYGILKECSLSDSKRKAHLDRINQLISKKEASSKDSEDLVVLGRLRSKIEIEDYSSTFEQEIRSLEADKQWLGLQLDELEKMNNKLIQHIQKYEQRRKWTNSR